MEDEHGTQPGTSAISYDTPSPAPPPRPLPESDKQTLQVLYQRPSPKGLPPIERRGHRVYILPTMKEVLTAVSEGRAEAGYVWGPLAGWVSGLRANNDP